MLTMMMMLMMLMMTRNEQVPAFFFVRHSDQFRCRLVHVSSTSLSTADQWMGHSQSARGQACLSIVSYLSSHLASIHRNWYPPHSCVQRLHAGVVHGLLRIVIPPTRRGCARPGARCSTNHKCGTVACSSCSVARCVQSR